MTAAVAGPLPTPARLLVPPAIRALADVQTGVVTRGQLAAAGLTVAEVRAHLRACRWQRVGRDVIVLHNSVLSVAQRRWVAVLMLDQPVALAGLTAAEVAGLQGFEEPEVHVVVSGTCTAGLPHWVRVHNSRRFSVADLHRVARPPRVRTSRALIDAAAWSRPQRRACAILCAGVQQRLTRASLLEAELRAAGAVRHCRLMRSVIGDIGGGGHTLAELDLGPLAVAAGLPPPRRQALRRGPGGRVRYVDAEFDVPDGTIFAVEIDGAVHLKPLSWWDDQARQNEIVIAGVPVLRFDSVTMRIAPDRVIDQLRRMRWAHS